MKGDLDKRSTNKYCVFHWAYGHHTNECYAWKMHLEELVKEGYYIEFMVKKSYPADREPRYC